MAERVPCSLRQLERYARKQFGLALRDWSKQLRVEQGASLVVTGEAIKVIAIELYYADAARFSKDFKEVFGVCPSEFFL
jgi:transcriptional regulator GlxA family with amidase domain